MEGVKDRLKEIVDDLEQMTEIECIVPQKHHRSLLGNKGKYVQEISANFSVQIKFPDRRKSEEPPLDEAPPEDGKNDIIVIHGRKDNAEKAKAALSVSNTQFMIILLLNYLIIRHQHLLILQNY